MVRVLDSSNRHKIFDHSDSESYSNHLFLLQVFPGSLLPHNYPDPQNPDHLLARSEVERRRDYIQPLHGQLGEEHPLVQLVCQCLRNIPARRPTAKDVLQQLQALKAQIEGPYGQIVKVDMEKVRVLREKDTEIRRLQQQMQQLEVGYPVEYICTGFVNLMLASHTVCIQCTSVYCYRRTKEGCR